MLYFKVWPVHKGIKTEYVNRKQLLVLLPILEEKTCKSEMFILKMKRKKDLYDSTSGWIVNEVEIAKLGHISYIRQQIQKKICMMLSGW